MSYQNVGTPRFYVDWNSYYNALEVYTATAIYRADTDEKGSYFSMGMLNPSNQRYISPQDIAVGHNCSIRYNSDKWILDPEQVNWGGVLGHNLKTVDSSYFFSLGVDVGTTELHYPYFNAINDIVNSNLETEVVSKPQLDGFSLVELNGTNATYTIEPTKIKKNHLGFTNIASTSVGKQFKFGSWCIGNYFDMPNSPDLSLKLSFEYDGVKTIQTRGGATLSNAIYTKPADWGDGGAWQLGSDVDGNTVDNLRSGRRVWDLSFSYISDSDLMPKVAATTNLGSGDNEYINPDTNTAYENSLLQGNDFFSQVWNRTLGGHLPFIFQANNSNNSPDQFSICRFDMNTLQYDQVANNVYNVKLKIREVW